MNTITYYPESPLPAGAARPTTDSPSPPRPVAVAEIVPPGRWSPANLREMWLQRELLYFLVWRDVKVRYKQTFLGALWAVLQPFTMMLVFTVIFSRLAIGRGGDLPYPLLAYLGLMPWMFFATAVATASNSVVNSEHLVTKVYFPRLMIPFATVGAALVDFAVSSLLLAGMLAWYRVAPGWSALWLPAIVASLILTALGVGTFLAGLNVAFRDLRYIVPFVMQVWMLATPAIYLPAWTGGESKWRTVMMCNPLANVIIAFRASCTGGTVLWQEVAWSAACGAALLIAGCLVFKRVESRFADII